MAQLAGRVTPLAGSESPLGSPHTPSWGRKVAAGHKCSATPNASEAAAVIVLPGSEQRVGAGSGRGGGSPVPSGWWAAAAVAAQDVTPSRLLRGTPFTASEGGAPDHPGNSGDVGDSGATPFSEEEALPDYQGGSRPPPSSSVITGIIRGFQMDRLSHAVSSAVASPVAIKGEELQVSRSDRRGDADVTAGSCLIAEAASGCAWSLNPTFGGVIGSIAAASGTAELVGEGACAGTAAGTMAATTAVGCASSAAPAATLAAGAPAAFRCVQVLEVLLGSQWSDAVGFLAQQPHMDPAHQQGTPATTPSIATALARGRINPVFETLRAPLAAIADPVRSGDMVDAGGVCGRGMSSAEAAPSERCVGGGGASPLLDPGTCGALATCSPAVLASSCGAARSGRSGSQKLLSTGSSGPAISRAARSPLIDALHKILLDQ